MSALTGDTPRVKPAGSRTQDIPRSPAAREGRVQPTPGTLVKENVVAESLGMKKVLNLVLRASWTDVPVFIT
ncbi:MAG: hypothetical protein ACM3WT_08645, partial [Bacillota bacterium]